MTSPEIGAAATSPRICPTCHTVASGSDRFCAGCGADLGSPGAGPPTQPANEIAPPESAESPEGTRRGGVPPVAVLLAVVAIAAAAIAFVVLRDDDGDVVSSSATSTQTSLDAVTTSQAPSTSATSTPTSAPASSSSTAPATTRGTPYTFTEIDAEPGLFCRDLAARGFTYEDAVVYWYREGAPARMDADGDAIPCATVYDLAVVDAYWSTDHPEVAVQNVARQMAVCAYEVTHLIDTETFPDGTHDVTVAVDVDGDRVPDVEGSFNVYAGLDIFPLDADAELLLGCDL